MSAQINTPQDRHPVERRLSYHSGHIQDRRQEYDKLRHRSHESCLAPVLVAQENARIECEISFAKRFEEAGLRLFFVALGDEAITIAMELAAGPLPATKTFREYRLERRTGCHGIRIGCALASESGRWHLADPVATVFLAAPNQDQTG